jgi:hypothetical protein
MRNERRCSALRQSHFCCEFRQAPHLPAIGLKTMTNINAGGAGMGLEEYR